MKRHNMRKSEATFWKKMVCTCQKVRENPYAKLAERLLYELIWILLKGWGRKIIEALFSKK